jgi:hypothetical protein
LEYFSDKILAAKLIYSLLDDSGTAHVITKNPLFIPKIFANLLSRKKVGGGIFKLFNRRLTRAFSDKLHDDWIKPVDLRRIFEQQGFKNIKVFPVVFGLSWGGKTLKIFDVIHKKINRRRLNKFISPFVESYLIVGEK